MHESFLKQVPTRLIVETLEPSIIYLFPRDMIQKLARENWEINMFYQKILEYSLIVSQVKADSWRFRIRRERIPPARNTSGNHQTRASGTHRFLSSDDTGDTKPCTLRCSMILAAFSVFFWRHTGVMLEIFPKERLVCKIQPVGNLLYVHT